MQKCYLVYSSISSVKSEDGTVVRAKWQDQISHEHKIHSEILRKLAQGERVDGIEKDPLESKEADYSYDYNIVPGFLRREASQRYDDKYHIQPHEKSIKMVNKMLEKVKNKKKRGHAASGDSDLIAEEREEGEESKHQSVENQPLGNY